MALMTLTTDEVAAHLKPILEKHLSNVHIGIEGNKGIISGKKFVLAVDIRFECHVTAPTTLFKIDLACSFAARAALESMGDSLRAERPYIKSLDATQCVIDLTKVPVGTKMLSDFIVLNSAHIPAQNGPFAELNVTIKPL
ncbi:MAG: hypothetical protein WCT04_19640 [Planctomycetota bacterium]